MRHQDENTQAETGRVMATVAERSRTPWEVADALHRLSHKYAGQTEQHGLLREAAQLIGSLNENAQRALEKANEAERRCASANGKIKLARLALDAVHVDG